MKNEKDTWDYFDKAIKKYETVLPNPSHSSSSRWVQDGFKIKITT